MTRDLPVPKSNLIIAGVEENDDVKEAKSDMNESDAGT